MDYDARERLMRRIMWGKVVALVRKPGKTNLIEVTIHDPKPTLLSQADIVYERALDKAIEDGMPTQEDAENMLISTGTWSNDSHTKLLSLESHRDFLSSELAQPDFRVGRKRQFTTELEKTNTAIRHLTDTKNSLLPITAESHAKSIKDDYILTSCIYIDSVQLDSELSNNYEFVEECGTSYYLKGNVSQSNLREIARTDPWRQYWSTSQACNMPVFDMCMVEMTQMQLSLCYWSKIYDNVFDSHDRPPSEVVEDNTLLDAWMDDKYKKAEAERNQQYYGDTIRGRGGGPSGKKTTFLMADVEGAKQVYNLNPANVRNDIRVRQDAIEKHGSIEEMNMPDTQRDLRIQAAQRKGT